MVLGGAGIDYKIAPSGDEATLVEMARDCEAILTVFAKTTAAVIQSPVDLRVVARYGVGVDNIDVDAATARGVPVTYIPDYCTEEVASHSLAMLLSLNRALQKTHRGLIGGGFGVDLAKPVYRLSGLRLGIVGFGRCGGQLSRIATGLGLEIVAYDPGRPNGAVDPETGARFVSLAEIIETADMISLHVPLSSDTHHLFSDAEFAAMKASAYLVNTSRGPVVDTVALARALEQGKIAGAGLDVYENEPLEPDHPLRSAPNTILTSHTAFYSETSLEENRRRAAQSVVDVLSGREPDHIANPDFAGGGKGRPRG
jgi:D-3-phosphoglycerate dehydrogenase